MDAKIFRVNYKSDFILTLTSDAGWMTPFCIKFWTGSPMLAYYASYDGETHVHCTYDPSEPTKLTVQFDDHHLPVGNLKYQVAYHFTVADFPENTEDEVTNQANVTTVIDGDTYQVMLDLNGETAPEIQFALPAYANELQRIQNEQTRIAQEQQRVSQEAARVTEFNGIVNTANNDHQRANEDHSRAQTDHQNALADRSQAASDHSRAQSDHNTATIDHSQASSDHSRAQSDHNTAISDHQTALSDHTQANTDHTRAESDHTRATADSSTAAADHRTASTDHTQANTDHTRAESDHQRVETDLAEVEEFSNSLGAYDISAAHATGSTLATYPDLATALGTNGSNIPEALRKGGMSVKFVLTYDNNSTKYVQYRLMADEFSTDTDKWAFSSNDVYVENPEFVNVVTDIEDKILYGVKNDGDFFFGAGVPSQIQEEIDAEEARATEVEATKVDKIPGKGLSTEDFTTAEKGKLGALPTNADLTTALGLKANSTDVYSKTAADELLVGKVDKVEGKGLSTNDYTDEEKEVVSVGMLEENPEYLQVLVDNSKKILEYLSNDGVKHILTKLDVQGKEFSSDENSEWLDVMLDDSGKIIFGVKKDGDVEFGCGIPNDFKDYVGSAVEEANKYTDEKIAPKIVVPNEIIAVVGDTLQIFYREIVDTPNYQQYGVVMDSNIGKSYYRYFEVTPAAGDIGNHTLTIAVYGTDMEVIAQKTVNLKVIAAATSPSSQKNVLVVGDSILTDGNIVGELSRRFTASSGDGTPANPTGLSLSNIDFIGRVEANDVRFEAVGGYSWKSYSTDYVKTVRFYVSGVSSITLGSVFYIQDYATSQTYPFTVVEVNVQEGTGNILCEVAGGYVYTSLPDSGTLVKVSGTADATVSYSSYSFEDGNPFWNSSSLDFQNYSQEHCNGSNIDVLYSELGTNGMHSKEQVDTTIESYIKPFIRKYHADYPNGKFVLASLSLPALYNAYASENWYIRADIYWYYLQKCQELAADSEFSSYVTVSQVICEFDCENGYFTQTRKVNNRASATEVVQNDAVHPSVEGKYMIADGMYREMTKVLTN